MFSGEGAGQEEGKRKRSGRREERIKRSGGCKYLRRGKEKDELKKGKKERWRRVTKD